MKNSFKIAFVALAIATSFAACKGKGTTGGDSTTMKDSSAKMADSSSKMADTGKMKADTGKMKMSADTGKKKM